MKLVFRRAQREPMWLLTRLWYTVSAALSVGILMIGMSYAVAGKGATLTTVNFRFIKDEPGGIHTHGTIMVVLSLVQLLGLAMLSQRATRHAWRAVRFSMGLVLAYAVWCVYAFVWASLESKHYSPGFWWYITAATIAFALIKYPPVLPADLGAADVD